AVLSLVVYVAPGFKTVRQVYFSWFDMKRSFFGLIHHGDPSIWRAFFLNVKMFLVAEPLILALALLIAVVRQIPGPVFFPFRSVAIAFTDFFRGVPVILVILMLGLGVPALYIRGLSYFPFSFYAVASLVLSYSAYVSEVFRAGIESVHPSQTAAARALG